MKVMVFRKLLLLLLISSSVIAQPTIEQFHALVKVEDQEKFYEDMVAKNAAGTSGHEQYSEYRAQLAVEWLTRGNIEKYKFYKDAGLAFSPQQLFELSNVLEYWVDDNKNITVVEQITRQLLEDIEKKTQPDILGRVSILLEVNAMANARLGNIDVAMKNLERSSESTTFRNIPYFRNSQANYFNRYGFILAAAGQSQKALDTLTKAVRDGNSTPKLITTFKEVYQKLKGDTSGMCEYVASLQAEAYRKIYKAAEKEWISNAKQIPDVTLWNTEGKKMKLSELKGKIVVIDFWSTVCKPCVAAFPAFELVVDLYKQEPFQLYVVNIGEDPGLVIKPFMDKKGYKLEVLCDRDEALFKALKAIGTPQKYIIDPEGKVRMTGIGYAGADDKEFYKLKAMIELTKARSSAGKRSLK